MDLIPTHNLSERISNARGVCQYTADTVYLQHFVLLYPISHENQSFHSSSTMTRFALTFQGSWINLFLTHVTWIHHLHFRRTQTLDHETFNLDENFKTRTKKINQKNLVNQERCVLHEAWNERCTECRSRLRKESQRLLRIIFSKSNVHK